MMSRKAQFKMFETIAVLVVFFFILVIGLMFYSNIEKKKISATKEEFSQLKAVEISQLVSSFPELECPTTLETENCVDEYKLNKLDNYYYDFFGYSTITVYDLEKDYLIYDNPKQGSSSRMYVPVSIYDPASKIKKFGILNITVYN